MVKLAWPLALQRAADRQQDVKSSGALIAAYGAGSDWQRGLRQFWRTARRLEPNIQLCNAAVNACRRARAWHSAFALLRAAHLQRLQWDEVSLGAAAPTARWRIGLELLSPRNVVVTGAVADAMAKAAEWASALALKASLAVGSGLQTRQVLSCAAAALQRSKRWQEALALFDQAPDESKDAPACGTQLAACAAAGRWLQAQSLLRSFRSLRLRLDLVAYGSAVCACAEAGGASAKAGFGLAVQMRQRGLEPGTVCRNTLARCGSWPEALGLTARADAGCINVAAQASAKDHQWQLACSLCFSMGHQSISKDSVSDTAAILGFGYGLRWQMACLQLPDKMPSSLHAGALLGALSAANAWRAALELPVESLTSAAKVSWRKALAALASLRRNGLQEGVAGRAALGAALLKAQWRRGLLLADFAAAAEALHYRPARLPALLGSAEAEALAKMSLCDGDVRFVTLEVQPGCRGRQAASPSRDGKKEVTSRAQQSRVARDGGTTGRGGRSIGHLRRAVGPYEDSLRRLKERVAAVGKSPSLWTGPVGEDSFTEDFLRFLAQADRYGAVGEDGFARPVRQIRARICLVRDFPFTLVEKNSGEAARGAQSFLQRFAATVNSGTVQRLALCFNDTRDDVRIVNKLLQSVNFQLVTQVVFDTVPRTFAQKALDGILRAQGLAKDVANTAVLGAECGGDLRQAINALQLLAAGRGTRVLTASASASSNGSRRGAAGRGKVLEAKVSQSDAPRDLHRTASLGLFHALGRVLYCKRLRPGSESIDPGPSKKKKKTEGTPEQLPHELLVPKARRPGLYYVPEEVVAQSNTDPQIFLHWVFTNAPRFYGDVEDLATFATSFAEADAWAHRGARGSHEVEGMATEELAASVQVRALLDANLHPIPPIRDPWSNSNGNESAAAAAFNMVRPLLWDVQRHRTRRTEELAGHLCRLPHALGSPSLSQSLLTTTLPFVHLILCASRGQHPHLQRLPHPLMQLLMDLSAPIDGAVLRSGAAESLSKAKAKSAEAVETPSLQNTALVDDPIED
ncbi:unnamed protein product [Effrenium voratum]|uniref:Pentatricopeptide repeat-containing protein, chloroplastic n=1 Tax=Effrenium voratum TaxID=2562239 RepID=A0AA36N7A8_9DINO|nr:unnamed protein product [Effrenium voratum]